MTFFARKIGFLVLVGLTDLIIWRWFRRCWKSITLDAVGGCSRDSIGLLAHGATVFAEENVWAGTSVVQELASEFMDET